MLKEIHRTRHIESPSLSELESHDAIFSVNRDRRITYWSDRATEVFGKTPGEVLGRLCTDVLSGDGRDGQTPCGTDCTPVSNAARNRTTKSFVTQWINGRLNKENFQVSIMFTPATDGAHQQIVHLAKPHDDEVSISDAISKHDTEKIDSELPATLTRRERSALKLLAAGLTTEEIANTMGIAKVTARNHILHSMEKLDAHTRLEAIIISSKRGLL